MANPTTARWAIETPPGTGVTPDVPYWMERLAIQLDDHAKDDQGLLADRPASTPQAPSNKRGRYYFATDTGQLFRDSGAGWHEIAIGAGIATGDYKYTLQTASHGARPDGLMAWLLADGTEVPAGYTALISVLTSAGKPFGTGAGGRPKLPDTLGRAVVGAGNGAGLTARAVGAAGGQERVTLGAYESGVKPHTHSVYDPGHYHVPPGDYFATVNGAELVPRGDAFQATTQIYANTAAATTGVSLYNSAAEGARDSHENMQPWVAAGRWFIKT